MAKKRRSSPQEEAAELLAGTSREQQLAQRIKDLEQQVDQLQESLTDARKTRVKLPVQGKLKTSKSAYTRFFLPDSHGAHVDRAALRALLTDLEYLKPREIYLMGDHLDCGGFLAQHHTLGYVAEAEITFEDDVAEANTLLDRVQEICPKAAITYLEGNHEERIEKWIVNSVLRNQKDARYLRSLVGPEIVLNLDKRGIRYVKKSECYDGCRVQGTVRAGKCYVTHGTKHGKNAANQMLNRFNACVVFGHVHKLMQSADRNVKDGEIGAWSVGHISRQQPLWKHGDPTDWSQGYGFQIVERSQDFLHINVHIIDGQSFLGSWAGVLT